MEDHCNKCNSKNVREEGEKEFHWGTFALHGLNPIHIQKLICKDCNHIFGRVEISEDLNFDILVEVN